MSQLRIISETGGGKQNCKSLAMIKTAAKPVFVALRPPRQEVYAKVTREMGWRQSATSKA
jgi:hypothetical protein